MRRIVCCARAASGHATAAPPSSADELAAHHSITSSARASSDGGTSRPSALAVLRFIDQLELGRLQYRQIGGLGALENAADVVARLMIHVKIGPVADQTARGDELPQPVHRWNGMARGQSGELFALAAEDRIGTYDERVGPLLGDHRKCGLEFLVAAGPDESDPQPHGPGSRLDVSYIRLGVRIAGIDEHSDDSHSGNKLVQQLEPLRNQRDGEDAHARNVFGRPA